MFGLVSDTAWRVVLLFALGVAPYAAPVDGVGAKTPLVASVRLAIFLAIALGLTFAIRRTGARHPRFALLAVITLVAVPIASIVFAGERGPLARGAWLATSLVWMTLAAALGGPLAARFARGASPRDARKWAIGLAAPALVAGAASLVVAAPGLSPRDRLWARAFAMNPGDQDAALAVASSARGRGDLRASYDALSACLRVRPKSCACAEGAAADAIDLARYENARSALDATVTCERTGRRMALTAEALIGTRAIDEGLREAAHALEQNADDPRAVYAQAWGKWLRGDAVGARLDAERAVKLGRGEPAQLLYGLLLYNANDVDGADAQFTAVLAARPDDARAVYDAALVAQKREKYHDAREGYLRALRLDPTLADARYNLAVLTYSRGAMLEAQHHVDEFARSYPSDGRIVALHQMLAVAPPRRAVSATP